MNKKMLTQITNKFKALPYLPEMIHSGAICVYRSTSSEHKYFYRDISEFHEYHNQECIHVFPWDDEGLLLDIAFPSKRVKSDEFSVYRLNSDVAVDFIRQNDSHQHKYIYDSLYLGLVKDDQVYQLIGFRKANKITKCELQISSVCTLRGYEILGGWDKLTSSASLDFGVSNCIAYADRSKSFESKIFESIGMKLDHKTPPVKWHTKGGLRTRPDYMKHSAVPIWEACRVKEGFKPIYDCGMLVYKFVA